MFAFLVLFQLAGAPLAAAAVLESGTESAVGTFRGVEFVRYAGRFSGETSNGPFRVPYEIVAPADVGSGNGAVIVEPPHFQFGPAGRDGTLGAKFLFGAGFSHATVGFGTFNRNLLNEEAVDAMIAGEPVVANSFPFVRDVEIIRQFAQALKADPYARQILGRVKRSYAFGVSQSAEALFELQYASGAEDLFDLTVLHVALWRPPFAEPSTLNALPDDFFPLPDIGKVMFVSSEGDRSALLGETAELRNAVVGPLASRNYRLYEVAGAPHFPLDFPIDEIVRTNPLDIAPTVRAAFRAGHRWVSRGIRPPRNALLKLRDSDDVAGVQDTVKDDNGNTKGGVRYPDVAIGRALFLASSPAEIVPGFPGLAGLWTDLACAPPSNGKMASPRFRSNVHYVRKVARQSLRLVFKGYLLPRDAIAMIRAARASGVGDEDFCN